MFVELHLISPATGKWPARSLETMTRIDRWYDTSYYWCVVTMCLSFFDTIMKCLSTDKHPTLHLVTPTKLQLVKTRTPTATDCASVRTICVINWTVTDLHYTASLPPGPMAQQQQRSTAIRSLREGSGKSAAIYHCCARPDRSDHAGAYRPDRSDHAGAYVAKKPKIEEHCTKCMQWYLGEAILRFFAP